MKGMRIARWLVVVAALSGLPTTLGLTACDCFLRAKGRIVDCATSEPIAGVTITVHVDMGVNEGKTLGETATTKADGTFEIDTGQNCGDWVTFRLAKPGFAVSDVQAKGTPDAPLALCLTPQP